jgi:glyoxylase-like metal-dependent hydrolase (beta-lactamase superfamily II)/8-oxo-dGTP pyrophosphatase MutT (NUDIX family)
LVRGDPLEVFAVRRADALRFFGGFWAFPGGRVHADDGKIPARADASFPASEADRRFGLAAARELFEETGILIARRPDGSFPTSQECEPLRRLHVDETAPFAQLLSERGLAVPLGDLAPLGRLVTPPFTTMRFDTAFFLAELPTRQHPTVWPGELQEGRWTTPATLLQQWQRGECLVSPPTVTILQALEDCPRAQVVDRLVGLFEQAADRDTHLIYFGPDVQFIPLRTLALPPSTHTNAYLVGRGPVYLIDPGPSDPDEQRHLFALLDANKALGRTLTAIVLTHHHPDHVGAATACAQRYGVPIWSHPLTAELLRVPVSHQINDGERLPLGPAADGFPDWHLQAIHTPGHAPGHLVFFDPHYQLLFAGDMVSTQTSIVIAPPQGDLSVYLASLRRLRDYAGRLLLPSHGGPTARSLETINEALEHRRAREEMLLSALREGSQSVDELAVVIYKGVPADLMKFARLQTLAGLLKLQAEGRAASGDGQRWTLTLPESSPPGS